MKTNELITRRKALIAGLTSAGGLLLTGCSKNLPPTYGNILRMGDTLTYAAHRALLPGQSLAREYSHKDITSFPAIGTTNPGDPNKPRPSETYRRFQATHLRTGVYRSRGWSPGLDLLAGRTQAVPFPDADHPPYLRGRLVRYR